MPDDRPRWKFERGTLWVMRLDNTKEDLPRVEPWLAVAMNEVRHDAAAELAQAMGLPDSAVLRRLDSGRRCFTAWAGNQIAAYGWLSRGGECVGEMERDIRLQPDEAYIWDCATLPPYRRQHLYSALLGFIVSQLLSENVRRVWIGTGLANKPSLRGFVNAGFRPAITLTYMRLFSLCVLWYGTPDGTPAPIVSAARRVFTAPHERQIGPLAIGWQPQSRPLICAQLEA